LHAQKKYEVGGRIQLVGASVVSKRFRIHYDFAFRVRYNEEAATIVSADGSRKAISRAIRGQSSLVFVVWTDLGWRVVDVTSA